jgi:predicted O-methyltransferase YrrM
MRALTSILLENSSLFKIAKMLPAPMKSFIKDMTRVPRRRAFAMSYFEASLQRIEIWSKKDSEDSNFYYKLTPHNRAHLAHLIAYITGTPSNKIVGYFDELEQDEELRAHIGSGVRTAGYGKDIVVNYGRRLGWYAFARIMKPKVIVETGVDHGVGSCVLASALLRNAAEGAPGRYYGTDINPKAGQLLTERYASTGEILYGDSITSLNAMDQKIDLFINDSDHSAEYEYHEYHAIIEKLSENGLILGDNSHVTESLLKFSEEKGRKFLFFSEKPADHWYPGAGIGISI